MYDIVNNNTPCSQPYFIVDYLRSYPVTTKLKITQPQMQPHNQLFI